MGTIDRRLGALEARHGLAPGDVERLEGEERREILRRMTDAELDACEAAVERFEEEGSFADEDAPILLRVGELTEEVRGGAA